MMRQVEEVADRLGCFRSIDVTEKLSVPDGSIDIRLGPAACSARRPNTYALDHVSATEEELERRELTAAGKAVIIGRSPECDLPVRDILLSRTTAGSNRSAMGGGSSILNSKNGTRVGWERRADPRPARRGSPAPWVARA